LNRITLERIIETANIFYAWSDRSWILDGAAVRVSIVGFNNEQDGVKYLDGEVVQSINADLTSDVNLTEAKKLIENKNISFRGIFRIGPFDIDAQTARKLLRSSSNNPNNFQNSDVVKPWMNGSDVTGRSRDMWIIDFNDMSLDDAQKYVNPFEYVKEHVKPVRDKTRRKRRRENWWIFGEHAPGMRNAIAELDRFIITAQVAKFRLFTWAEHPTIPDQKLIVIARDDDYFFGVLHSRLHEMWSLRMGSWIGKGNDSTYTPSTSFQTFPFPWPPGQEPAEADDPRVAAIGHWARALVNWRDAWLNPPRDGLYAGLGAAYDKMLKKRTLTNLYNGLVYYRQTVKAGHLFDPDEFDKVTRQSVSRADIQELDDIHAALDTAVLDTYGWPHDLSDEQILEHLLALNLQRAA
jgi:hypothetical protein